MIRFEVAMDDTFETLIALWEDIKLFTSELSKFILKSLHLSFLKFEQRKGVFVTALYRQRGKLARRLQSFWQRQRIFWPGKGPSGQIRRKEYVRM